MARIRTVPACRVARAHTPSWFVHVLGFALVLGVVTRAHAAGDAATDTLTAQVIPVDANGHAYLVDSIAERTLGAETLHDRVGQVAGAALVKVEATCRTNLMPKYAEPGSPWLGFRLLARVRRDSCDWFIGALSCADTLCGGNLVSHERLAFVSVTPARAQVLLYPGEASTIGDPGSCVIDSVALHKGSNHFLVQTRRRMDSQHPCFDGAGRSSAEVADFFVLRGDRVVQAFSLQTAVEAADHDDESGDSGLTSTGTLLVSPVAIQLDRKTDEWQETADGDPRKTQHRVRGERIRLRFSDGSGTYRLASRGALSAAEDR